MKSPSDKAAGTWLFCGRPSSMSRPEQPPGQHAWKAAGIGQLRRKPAAARLAKPPAPGIRKAPGQGKALGQGWTWTAVARAQSPRAQSSTSANHWRSLSQHGPKPERTAARANISRFQLRLANQSPRLCLITNPKAAKSSWAASHAPFQPRDLWVHRARRALRHRRISRMADECPRLGGGGFRQAWRRWARGGILAQPNSRLCQAFQA